MKKIIGLILVFFVLFNLTGCETLKKKFVRKKKEGVKMPRIYQVKKYEKKPSPELYKKHYTYWESWQSEIEMVLGQNHKKDVRCIEEIISNLRDMQNMLVPEKSEILAKHVDKIARVKDTIMREDLTTANRDSVLMTLEHEGRFIRRDFVYSKVRNNLRENFENEPS